MHVCANYALIFPVFLCPSEAIFPTSRAEGNQVSTEPCLTPGVMHCEMMDIDQHADIAFEIYLLHSIMSLEVDLRQ